jgi:hypothetical protein
MEPIILKNTTSKQEPLEAIFLPDKGMNMISYKRGGIEVIDQSTKVLFDERFAGLGALIGPHFHRRRAAIVPQVKNEELFPHIARVKAKGVADPFSHGIGRYALWKATFTPTKVEAKLTGKDLWNGVPLAELEGQEFTMTFIAELLPFGLQINLSVVSSTDSIVGIHYYYHLPQGTGRVISKVQDSFLDNSQNKPLPPEWQKDFGKGLNFDLAQPADYTFFPYPDKSGGVITLEAGEYILITKYTAQSQENGWQLYHPEGASYVCIEPVSAKDPRHPNLTVSSLEITLSII